MTFLGLIPARGGSKGFPGKNIARLAGRPLIAHTIEAALASRRLDRVVVSTDDPAIADIARHHGAAVPFLRPARLAADDSTAVQVIEHALDRLEVGDGRSADAVVYLQPTSPLRTAEHIDAAIALFLETGADTVVSVIEVPHMFHPLSVMELVDHRLRPYLKAGASVLRRQDKPTLFARNGPAVLVVRREFLVRSGALYGERTCPFVMADSDSIDIDTPADLERAEWALARRCS